MTTLYIVSTPIGNLADVTLRAIETLKLVDWIAAEDTRHSKRLLSHYQIHTPVISLHEHNEDDRIAKIIAWLDEGKSVALISDAGTPLVSDPGFKLVRAIKTAGYSVVPVPGACAAIAALVASGLPADKFIFEGFLPVKSGALKNHLELLKGETRTIIFYESVHRIVKTMKVFCEVFGGNRLATVARELTKTYETIKQDNLSSLSSWIEGDQEQQKGEFVIVLQGAAKQEDNVADQQEMIKLLTVLLEDLPLKQAVKLACKISGLGRNEVYAQALKLSA